MVTKEQIYSTISKFIDSRLDIVLGDNPFIRLMKPTVKRAIDNMIDKNAKELNKVLSYLENKDGKIDLEGILEDTLVQFEEMPETTVPNNLLGDIKVGQGRVSFNLDIPYLDTVRMISLNKDDINSFIEMLKKSAYV